ncbi:MAG: glycosyltransferase family 9 protein, partial [Nanoarchaeota archaeon]
KFQKKTKLLTKIFPNNKEQHKIEDNLDVIRSIGIETKDKHLELFPSTVAEKRIKKILKKYPRPWIGINAASAHYSQRWYKEKWKEVIEYYQKRKATIIMMGVKQERDQVQSILNELSNVKGTVNLTGKTTFDEFMSLIKNLDLLITIDSSATHIASAFDKPVLTLFGPTIPTFWGPTGKSPAYIWKEEGCVGCRRYFCIYNKGYECMRSITPDEVITKARTLLKK